MNNWKQAQKYLNEVNNGDAMGVSLRENVRYIDSVQGKLTLLQEKFRSLVNTTIDGNMAKEFLNIVISVVDVLDTGLKKLDEMGLALPTVVGSIAGLVKSLKFQSNGGMATLIAQQREFALATQQSTMSQAELNAQINQSKGFMATLKEGFSYTGIGKPFKILKNIGNSFKENKQSMNTFKAGLTAIRTELRGVEVQSIGTKVAISALNTVMTALSMVKMMVITTAVTKAIEYFTNQLNKTNDALQKNSENIQKYNDKLQSLTDKKNSLSDIAKEYDTLSNKINKTTEEQDRFKQLQQQIIDICGEDIVLG